MTESDKKNLEEMKKLVKSIRFNHDKNKFEQFNAKVNPAKELNHYDTGITQLTLPHRFGLYKTPTKNTPKVTEVELEDPPSRPDSTSSILSRNPNHKIRSIFD